jgi:ATP-dependent Lon protease
MLDSTDLHVHFPSAATPKDGPSAGVAIATALVSLLTGRPARHDLAMTGEMSLLGQVLAVGGVREKLLAAIRCGVPEVILPARNGEECLRLDPDVRNRVRIHLIENVREAFDLALLARTEPARAPLKTAAARRRAAKRASTGDGAR